MSKRSGLSRLEDLKRHFVDIGRYRYLLNKFDMETWRDKTCPICNKGFAKEITYFFMSQGMHNECVDTEEFQTFVQKHYDDQYDDEECFPFSIPRLPEGTDTDDLP